MTQDTISKLNKIIDHLENGKRIHDVFDFKVIRFVGENKTFGCAIGEFPAIFPNDWEYIWKNGIKTLSVKGKISNTTIMEEVATFLGIPLSDAFIFFSPYRALSYIESPQYTTHKPPIDWDEKEVAQHIRNYTKYIQSRGSQMKKFSLCLSAALQSWSAADPRRGYTVFFRENEVEVRRTSYSHSLNQKISHIQILTQHPANLVTELYCQWYAELKRV